MSATPPVDMRKIAFKVNDKVARAVGSYGGSTDLYIATVTKIVNDKVYLDNAKQPLKYPERLLIVNGVFTTPSGPATPIGKIDIHGNPVISDGVDDLLKQIGN